MDRYLNGGGEERCGGQTSFSHENFAAGGGPYLYIDTLP